MIRVLFFAQVRERLACDGLDWPWPEQGIDLDTLQAQLIAAHDATWRTVLEQPNIIRAVNQAVVAGNPALADGDEVAFFPPVTGG